VTAAVTYPGGLPRIFGNVLFTLDVCVISTFFQLLQCRHFVNYVDLPVASCISPIDNYRVVQ